MSKTRQVQSGRDNKVIRKVGNLEAYHCARHALRQYRGTMVTCHYVVPGELAKPSQHQKLRETVDLAVARTILQYPVLQAGLIEEGSKRPSHVELVTVNLNHHVQWQVIESTADYGEIQRDAVEHQLDERFVDLETQPGWRLFILQKEEANIIEAMFTWNHVVTDGTGAKIFHESMLRCLNMPPGDDGKVNLQDRILNVAGHAQHFPPAQENMCKYEVSTMFVTKELWKAYKLPFNSETPGADATWAPKKQEVYKTNVRSINLDNAALQRVLAACREHKTTLTGLFHGIMVLSMASQLGENEATALRSQTAVNMRPFTPASPKGYTWLKPTTTMGNIVSGISHDYDAATIKSIRKKIQKAASEQDSKAYLAEPLWSVSTSARADIKQFTQLGAKNNVIGLLKFVPDKRGLTKDIMKLPRQYSWLVTNLGVLDGAPPSPKRDGQGDDWTISRATFLLCADVLGPAFQIGMIAVKGGDLGVDFSWQEGVIEVKLAERMVSDVEGWLNYLGRPVG